ncbi:MAG: hypothetical protein ACRC6G_06380, partial [Deefgea sp.]
TLLNEGNKMSHPQSALLVIDVQDSFFHRPYFNDADFPAFQTQLLKLINACQAKAISSVTVIHVEPDGVFAIAARP